MTQLLDVFGFLSVLLRGFTLAFQSMVIGGLVFTMLLPQDAGRDAVARLCLRMVAWTAGCLAVVQACYVAADAAILVETADLALRDIVGANFFIAGSSAVALSLGVAALSASTSTAVRVVSVVLAGGIIAATVTTSHAAARVEQRAILALLTSFHHAATACWIGGLPYLLLTMARCSSPSYVGAIASRFSRLALISVTALLGAGLGLSLLYVDSPAALYGTSYGAMLSAKGAFFGLLMILGAMNYFLVRRIRGGETRLQSRLRRFVEAEVGIGFTVILVAASLTSQPPSVDLLEGRITASELMTRFTPSWPRLVPPNPAEMYSPALRSPEAVKPTLESSVPGQLSYPITQGELELSEFNHNTAGLIVLVAGLLAFGAQWGWTWARVWPMAFLGMAIFLFFLADADYWPIGPLNFWWGFADSEVLLHRLVVPLVVAFAIFEWRVQTGRSRSGHAALVFPIVCAIGGALLLTHTHSLNNVKEELFAELSHIPIAVLGVTAGWSRWLELRLPSGPKKILSRVWPTCLVLVGLILLFYRES